MDWIFSDTLRFGHGGCAWNGKPAAIMGASIGMIGTARAQYHLRQMINISTQRTIALQMHPPTIIFVMLAGLMLVGSLLAGYGMASRKSRNWIHTVAFVVILALTFYVIRDLEFPRLPGLVGT